MLTRYFFLLFSPSRRRPRRTRLATRRRRLITRLPETLPLNRRKRSPSKKRRSKSLRMRLPRMPRLLPTMRIPSKLLTLHGSPSFIFRFSSLCAKFTPSLSLLRPLSLASNPLSLCVCYVVSTKTLPPFCFDDYPSSILYLSNLSPLASNDR